MSDQDMYIALNRNYAMASAFIWLLFEYFLTLDQEIKLFWGRKPTAASILFQSNRYLPLFCAAWWTPWWMFSSSFEVCAMRILVGGIGEYLLYLPVGAFNAMRAYALTGRHKRWAILTFLLSISPAMLALVLAPWIHFQSDPNAGCSMEYNIPKYLLAADMILGRVSLVLADVILVGITWRATYRHGVKINGKPPSISEVLLRNGTIYFVAQLVLNIFYPVSVLLPPDVFGSEDLNSIASLFIQPATSVLITHFLFDLQHASRRTRYLPTHAGNCDNMLGSLVVVLEEDDDHDGADGPGHHGAGM